MELTADEQEERALAAEANMAAQGVATHESVAADYFGFDETLRLTLPDGLSYIEHRVLNEGQRRKYLNAVNRDVRIQKATGDALMRMSPGEERMHLLKAAIVGWNLKRGGSDVAFTDRNLTEFLEKANPRIVDLIEKEVRKANPWLMAELSLEDIDKEINDLTELREKKVEEEEGKAVSSDR